LQELVAPSLGRGHQIHGLFAALRRRPVLAAAPYHGVPPHCPLAQQSAMRGAQPGVLSRDFDPIRGADSTTRAMSISTRNFGRVAALALLTLAACGEPHEDAELGKDASAASAGTNGSGGGPSGGGTTTQTESDGGTNGGAGNGGGSGSAGG